MGKSNMEALIFRGKKAICYNNISLEITAMVAAVFKKPHKGYSM